MLKKCAWETYDEKHLKKLEKLSKEYRDFLDNGKTERECIDTIVNTIEAEGYKELESLMKDGKALQKGDKVYSVWMNKSIAMFRLGSKPLADGIVTLRKEPGFCGGNKPAALRLRYLFQFSDGVLHDCLCQ